jgi:hypothetical protein
MRQKPIMGREKKVNIPIMPAPSSRPFRNESIRNKAIMIKSVFNMSLKKPPHVPHALNILGSLLN